MGAKRTVVVLGMLIGFMLHAYAQTITVDAVVLDESRTPIKDANVVLMQTDSTIVGKTSTGENGSFSITAPRVGDYILTISHIGYSLQSLFLKSLEKDVHLSEIILQENVTHLENITVTAQATVNRANKTILFPTLQQKKYSVDGFSLLNNLMLPQLDVDLLNKTVSSRGKTVTLLVNGKPIKDKNEITALRPNDILRIEYHELPTGIFAEYESVINYITRQYASGGYISFSGLQHSSIPYGNYFVMGRFSHKHSEHSIGYSFDYLRDQDTYRENEENFVYPDESVLKRNEIGEPSLERNHAHNVFYNYNFRHVDNQFNAQIGYKKDCSNQNYLSSLNYDGNDRFFVQHLSEFNQESQDNPYLSAYGRVKLKNNQSLFIRGGIDYSKNRYQYSYAESAQEQGNEDNRIEALTSENYWQTMLGLVYRKLFSKSRELSINLVNYTDVSKSMYRDDNDINQDNLTNSENIFSLNFSKQWENTLLSFSLGMSSLLYRQRAQPNKVFWSARPKITFRHIFNKSHTLQYRTGLTNSFPILSLFTDSEQNIDFIQKRKGNPSLDVTKIFSNLLSYSYSTNRINLNIMIDQFFSWPNASSCVIYEDNYFVHSYKNDGKYSFVNPEIGVSLKLVNERLSLKVNGGLKRYDVSGENSIHLNNWYIKSTLRLLYKNFNANLYFNSSQKGAYSQLVQWKNSAIYGLFITYNKKHYSLMVGTQNPFSGYQRDTQSLLGIYSNYSALHNSQNDHLLFIKATLNLDFGRSHKYSNINSQKHTNSAIMKNSKSL